jgi:hypothetical protein
MAESGFFYYSIGRDAAEPARPAHIQRVRSGS